MDTTESYTIFLKDTNKTLEIDDLKEVWSNLANDNYNKTNIFIEATLELKTVLCNITNGCVDNESGYLQVTCIRNPLLAPDDSNYLESLKEIIIAFRKVLGDPYAIIMKQNIEMSHFINFD